MKEFKPPMQISLIGKKVSIFLAGTIDMGKSSDWQKSFTTHITLKNWNAKEGIHIYNPRRENWDSSWEQTIENSYFYQQVNWELDAMNKADIIIMNFFPESQSPITLLELGLYANTGKLHVCCPKSFWRRGNVEIVCNNYNIPFYEDTETLLSNLKLNT